MERRGWGQEWEVIVSKSFYLVSISKIFFFCVCVCGGGGGGGG